VLGGGEAEFFNMVVREGGIWHSEEEAGGMIYVGV
jgi:hypothetical protein